MFQEIMPPISTSDADVEADDVADAEQRGRQVGAHVGDALADACRPPPRCPGMSRRPLPAASFARPPPSADRPRIFTPCAGFSPAFSTSAAALPSGNASFWSTISARRSGTEKNTPRMPPRPAIASTQMYWKSVPVAEDHQRRDREDHARRDRRAGRGAGLHDVVLEDAAAAEHAQHRHRNHGGRNRRCDGHAGEQPEVGVGGGEDHRQHDRERNCAKRQLGRYDLVHVFVTCG